MRVIEKFVTFVPREDIHPDAKWFMQDSNEGVLKSSPSEMKPEYSNNWWCRGAVNVCGYIYGEFNVAVDADQTLITREELMKAYDLVEQGYTLWFGGECPVEKGTLVDVVYRNGNENLHVGAGVYPCFTGSDFAKNAYDWSEDGVGADIIAYRLSEVEDKSSSLVPLSEEKVKAIQANIKHTGNETWTTATINSLCIDPESGKYVSVGKEKVFIKDSDGTEYSFPLEELSKVIK